MIHVKSSIQDEEKKNKTEAFHMHQDFRTTADGLGGRTYRKGNVYRLDTGARGEAEASPEVVAELLYVYPHQLNRADFDRVTIVSRISRWFTSDGVDAWHLANGEEHSVPSNLAVFLVTIGCAEYGRPQ
jgi:hypothetical protein